MAFQGLALLELAPQVGWSRTYRQDEPCAKCFDEEDEWDGDAYAGPYADYVHPTLGYHCSSCFMFHMMTNHRIIEEVPVP